MESSNRDNLITFQFIIESKGYTNDNNKEEIIEIIDYFPKNISDIISDFINPNLKLVRI
jgi:hypothetical protein